MRKVICLFLLFVISLFYLQAQSPKFISVKGKEIIGTDGKPFLMKGTNLGNWLVPEGYMFKFKHATSPRLINQTLTELIGPDEVKNFWKKYLDNYITAADIHYLKTIGMNSLRVPFDYRLFTDEEYMGGRGEARGFQLLDKVISWCKKEGLYVLLDMHCAPGGQTGDNIDNGWGYPFLFDHAASRQLTIDVWQKIAKRYKNETTVLGYDLLNEPIAHYFDAEHFNPLLEPLYKQITKVIRASDPNHLIFLGGAQWNSNFNVFGEPFDKKLVYTFHKYWTATTVDVIQDYINFRDKYNVPIYCGETGENKDEWVTNFRVLLEQHNIGWHFWPYKKMENKAGIVEFKMPEHYSEIIQYADTAKKNFEAIRKLRPASMANIKKALDDFLINCTYSHCTPNEGYIKALGLGKN